MPGLFLWGLGFNLMEDLAKLLETVAVATFEGGDIFRKERLFYTRQNLLYSGQYTPSIDLL